MNFIGQFVVRHPIISLMVLGEAASVARTVTKEVFETVRSFSPGYNKMKQAEYISKSFETLTKNGTNEESEEAEESTNEEPVEAE